MKLAFVSPRYGAELTHGPEHACRLLAEQLSVRHDIDVLTTSLPDPTTGKAVMPEGADRMRGVLIRRFASTPGDRPDTLLQLTRQLTRGPHSQEDEIEWVRHAGPTSPGLTEYLRRHHRNYDALVFFSAVHATTLHNIDIAPERTILFPWLRQQPALRLGVVQRTLASATALGLMARAERKLVALYSPQPAAPQEVVGIGVLGAPLLTYPRLSRDTESDTPAEPESEETASPTVEWPKPHLTGQGSLFRRRHRLMDGPIVLHGGSIERDSGCEEMIEYFDGYVAGGGQGTLVLMGVKLMKLPQEPYLHTAGVLPSRDRMAAFEAADVTMAPRGDDLSAETVLESFAAGTPVLAAATNEAAVELCTRANAGLYYANREEFIEALSLLTGDSRLRAKLGANGSEFIEQHCRWDHVIGRFDKLLSRLKKS